MSKSIAKQGKSVLVKGGFRMLKRTNTVHTPSTFTQVAPKVTQMQRSGSITSLNSDIEEEANELSEAMTRRGRRAAIVVNKNVMGDSNAENSQGGTTENESEETKNNNAAQALPGVDILKEHHKKILKKQHTIADLTARAYSISNSSTSDDSRKRSGMSFLKLIDKKSKSKESLVDLQDALTQLTITEFHDSHLASFKDKHWSDLLPQNLRDSCQPIAQISLMETKRREAVWELFKSELVFLIDHLLVLKHCFLEPMKKLQVDGHLMFIEPEDLFGNLDELCYVSYNFCRDLISILSKEMTATEFGNTETLLQAFIKWTQHSKDGEVFHNYCLNYDCALTYLDILHKYEQFSEFEKWCEMDPHCNRLQLTDLLVAPMQHYTKMPLLLANMRKYTEKEEDQCLLTENLEKVENSLKSLEDKMRWLKNFEHLQEIQLQLIWPPIAELEPRVFIPEFLKHTLSKQPCERLIANPKRQLLHEGFLTLNDGAKVIEIYAFLFDDLLLLTKIKKHPKKKSICESAIQTRSPTEGALFVVYRQPIALDRFTVHDVGLAEANANGLRNAFVLVTISRFQQITGVYTMQSQTESGKVLWTEQLRESQQKFQEKLKAKLLHGDTAGAQTNTHSKLINKIQKLHIQQHEHNFTRDSPERSSPFQNISIESSPSGTSTTNPQSNQLDFLSTSPGQLTPWSRGSRGGSLVGLTLSEEVDESGDGSPPDSYAPGLTPRRSGPSCDTEALSALCASLPLSRPTRSRKPTVPISLIDHSYVINVHAPFSPPLSPTLHSCDGPYGTDSGPESPLMDPPRRFSHSPRNSRTSLTLLTSDELILPKTNRRKSGGDKFVLHPRSNDQVVL